MKKYKKDEIIVDTFMKRSLTSEVEIVSNIDHHTIAKFIEIVQDETHLCLVFEKCEGMTMKKALSMQKK